jgi:hypothetical protein
MLESDSNLWAVTDLCSTSLLFLMTVGRKLVKVMKLNRDNVGANVTLRRVCVTIVAVEKI